MFYDLRQRFLDYIEYLTIYDYFALSWIGLLFFLSVVISLLLIKKNIILSFIVVLFSFIMLLISPIVIKVVFDQDIKKVELSDQKIDRLGFSKILVVKGSIKNISKIDFKKCRVLASILEENQNSYQKYINYLKPLRKKSIVIEKELKREDSYSYKIVFEDFNLTKGYLVKVYGECY
jgi:hypothetical protein